MPTKLSALDFLRARGYKDFIRPTSKMLEGPFWITGTFDTSGPDAAPIDLKLAATWAKDWEFRQAFGTGTLKCILHIEAIMLVLTDDAAVKAQDPEDWLELAENTYLDIEDGDFKYEINLRDAVGFDPALDVANVVDSDASTAFYLFNRPARIYKLKQPIEVDLETAAKVDIAWKSGAANTLAADSGVRGLIIGAAWDKGTWGSYTIGAGVGGECQNQNTVEAQDKYGAQRVDSVAVQAGGPNVAYQTMKPAK